MNKSTETILLKTTSIIYMYNNSRLSGSATCFFCQNEKEEKFLVTNYHVLRNATNIKIKLTSKKGINYDLPITLGDDIIMHKYYDLCVINFTSIYNDIVSNIFEPILGFIQFNGIVQDFSSFNRIENLIMIG